MIRKLLLTIVALCHFFLFPSFLFAATPVPPKPVRDIYVQDLAGVLNESTKNTIRENGAALDKRTGAQIVVLTVPTVKDTALETYSLAVLREWGIGNKEKNNGVLLLLVVNDRKSRIEVGYGLEGVLPDGLTGRIQDQYLIPYLRQGDYNRGVINTYAALLQKVAGEYGVTVENLRPEAAPASYVTTISPLNALIFFGGLLIILGLDQFLFHGAILRLLLYLLLSRGGRGGGGFGGGPTYGGGSGGGGGSSRNW